MTSTSADREHVVDDVSDCGEPSRVDHPQVDGSGSVGYPSGPSSSEWQLRDLLAPFVAWLATQDLDESERRRHREAVERFLRWCHADTGAAEDRRRRYEQHLQRHDADHLRDARAGLGWWTHHRKLLACTLPTDR